MTEASTPAATQVVAPAELPDEISLEDARSLIDSWQDPDSHSLIEGQESGAEEPPPKPAKTESSKEVDADPETDPREQQTQEDEPEESENDLPPIDPPRSWTKEEKEAFAQWPREAQESIARVASTREAEFRRSQNEAAEAKKALDAKLAEADQVRKEYEGKLPSLVKNIEDALQNEFSDIRDLNDVRKLQAEDPFRFQAWQLRQMELSAAKTAQEDANKRSINEAQMAWNTHIQTENAKFEDSVPEGERKSLTKMRENAPQFLADKGFKQSELSELAAGKSKLSIYDHRVQTLIRDSMRLSEILAAPKAVSQKPVPTVQKPGTHRVASDEASLSALSKRLDQSGSEADGWELLQAQSKSRERRASR